MFISVALVSVGLVTTVGALNGTLASVLAAFLDPSLLGNQSTTASGASVVTLT